MNKLIEWFNGKKTVIGTIFLFTATFLSEVVIGMWGVNNATLLNVIETLNWFGLIFGGVGLTHKGLKSMNITK